LTALLACLTSLLPTAASAALGGTLQSVQADQAHLNATRRMASPTGYDVHELTLASGTVVREYVTASGTVFGVAWQGPVKPDLNQLLGTSFARVVAAGQTPHGGHRRLAIHAPDLVVDSGGRMRNFAGRAYLPGVLPASVSTGDIQ
jgi:hypothetical protein